MLKKQSLRNDNKDKTHLRTPSDADHRLSAWKLNLVTVFLRCLIIDNKFIRPFSSASPRSGCGGSRLSGAFQTFPFHRRHVPAPPGGPGGDATVNPVASGGDTDGRIDQLCAVNVSGQLLCRTHSETCSSSSPCIARLL